MFCRYSLRTTDADAARAFYAEAIGLQLPHGAAPGSRLECWPLHERARAQGAPPHWLGHLAVENADDCADRVVTLGGERLGPTVETPGGDRYATVRDPSGAVIAFRQCAAYSELNGVAFHQHHTRDADEACRLYEELCGVHVVQTVDHPEIEGGHRLFAYRGEQDVVGSIANTARWPGVHAQWLFYFLVKDINEAVARVRTLGGRALEIHTMGNWQLVPCEDPQGAAFGLVSVVEL